ncbi:hypothetical protein Zmor_007657 [Zophobas morio]|uniref:Odorant receptor n=1 Tax=Zophobas morio TaxID=2755281 RepID=A0AA38MPN6_9CUCU|nr:hypothetical protein Zmor_007657 [Zophobas morio]
MTKFEWSLPNKTNYLLLKICGIWPEGDQYQFNLYFLFFLTSAVFFLYPHNLCQIIVLFYTSDITVAGAIIFVILSDLIAVVKMHLVVGNIKMLKKLTAAIDNEELQPQNAAQERAVMDGIDFWRKSFYFFLSAGISTLFFWGTFPILDGGYKEYKRPFIVWYPYDFKKSPYYELTYMHQMISIIFIANLNMSVDSFASALLTFIAAQCEILSDKLKNLHQETDARRAFVGCIKHHLQIIRYADDTSKFLDLVVFLQFVPSSVSFGLTLFQLSTVVPFTSQFYSFLTYGIAVTLEIFMYCWFGNEVELKSHNIPYAAYECQWFEFSKSLKYELMFFTLRTQKPIKFSAKGLFYTSLEPFVRILRTGWSYFALLSTINTS